MSRIILINGTTSSGKTSIARLIQNELRNPAWILMSIDAFCAMYPDHADAKVREWLPSYVRGFCGSIASFARAGIPVIVDTVFMESRFAEEFIAATAGISTICVGLDCPLEVLEERERARGDRTIGQARYQFDEIHKYLAYDLRLDTSKKDPQTCAREIIEYLAANP